MSYNLVSSIKNEVSNIPQIKIRNDLLGELVTVSKKSGVKDVQTMLKNSFGKSFGTEIFILDEATSNIRGHLLHVDPEYRRKGHNFGEILRLSSIIAMVENSIKTFDILSTDCAAFFHAKYKFSPNTSNILSIRRNLNKIAADCKNKNNKLSNDAEIVLKKFDSVDSLNPNDTLCQQANTIINDYMQTALKDKTKYDINSMAMGFDMKITLDDVYKNKDFFNELFAKHKIDYRI